MTSAREELARRIHDDWLARYLADYEREPGGYRGGEELISELDAMWFLRAFDEGIVRLLPKARMLLPASRIKAMIFWSGSTKVTPRPASLHREGILSAGMAARLHLEFGWPIASLGFEYPPDQPREGRRAFDLAAVEPSGEIALAGEAKKARHELDHLLQIMESCGQRGAHEHQRTERGVANGHRKWQGLVRCRPSVFFTFGPEEDWSIFSVEYGKDGSLALEPASSEQLRNRTN